MSQSIVFTHILLHGPPDHHRVIVADGYGTGGPENDNQEPGLLGGGHTIMELAAC